MSSSETLEASDDLIREGLESTRIIALVGFSANPSRPSHSVAAFLQRRGYRVIPVNPGLAGQTHLGETVRASLAEVPEAVDMVDIFRRSEEAGAVIDQALAQFPDLGTVWTQLGVRDDAAADRARGRGVRVVQDRCPAIEIPRLGIVTPR